MAYERDLLDQVAGWGLSRAGRTVAGRRQEAARPRPCTVLRAGTADGPEPPFVPWGADEAAIRRLLASPFGAGKVRYDDRWGWIDAARVPRGSRRDAV